MREGRSRITGGGLEDRFTKQREEQSSRPPFRSAKNGIFSEDNDTVSRKKAADRCKAYIQIYFRNEKKKGKQLNKSINCKERY